MVDIAKQKDITVDIPELERELGCADMFAVNQEKIKGIAQLKKTIEQTANHLYKAPVRDFINNEEPCYFSNWQRKGGIYCRN